MRQLESQLQCACIFWFRLQYPQYKSLLFAIPNGSSRHPLEAARLKREGVLAGVADCFLAVMRCEWHDYICDCVNGGVFIEFKAGNNKQTVAQIEFQNNIKEQGYIYAVIRSFEEFKELIEKYLKK